MTSFLSKGKVAKLECNANAESSPETKAVVTYAGIACSTYLTDQHQRLIVTRVYHILFQNCIQCTIMQKMADQGRSDFYVVFTMSLCAL